MREIAEGRLQSSALPEFSIEVGWLWQRPLPSKIECADEIL